MSKERQVVFLGCSAATRASLGEGLARFGFQVGSFRDPRQAAGAVLAAGLGSGLLVVDLPGLQESELELSALPRGLGDVVPTALLTDPAAAGPAAAELARLLGACEILDASAPLEELLLQIQEVFFRQQGQRRSPRWPVEMMVEVRHAGGAVRLQAHNISRGGIYLRTLKPRAPGEQLRLRFDLPGLAKPVEVQGEVVHVIDLDPVAGVLRGPGGSSRPVLGHPGMGVRFVELPDEALAALEKLGGE